MAFPYEELTPGYEGWESTELSYRLQEFELIPEGKGLWIDLDDEINLMVTALGLFVGWNNSQAGFPRGPFRRFGDVKHIQRDRLSDLPETIKELRKLRLLAMTRCRYCGRMETPGWISNRCCIACMSDVLGIIF